MTQKTRVWSDYYLEKGIMEGIEKGFVKGRAEGIVKGREEGREEGERKRIEDLAGVVSSVMQKMDVPLEEALEITSISDEDRPLIIDRLSSS